MGHPRAFAYHREIMLDEKGRATRPDAATCQGCQPFKSFFRPAAIELSQGGITDFNLAMIFHEGLHGITGWGDQRLQQAFGCENQSGNLTRNITDYLEQFITSPPPQTINGCQ